MNRDVENAIKNCSTYINFQQNAARRENNFNMRYLVYHGNLLAQDMFCLYNKYYLSIVDYDSKFPIIKKTEDFSADSLILVCEIIFFRIWGTQENNVRLRW